MSRLGHKFWKKQGVIFEDDGKFYSKNLHLLDAPKIKYSNRPETNPSRNIKEYRIQGYP